MFRNNYGSEIRTCIFSFEVARHICDDSYGLVFGFNTFLALLFQSILTLIVADDAGLALDPRTQVRTSRFKKLQKLSVFLSIRPSVCLSVRLSVHLYICPSVCLLSGVWIQNFHTHRSRLALDPRTQVRNSRQNMSVCLSVCLSV
jgi:hypothetical protein